MRIIHLIQKPQKRGAETFASQLANHQVEQGHQVLMISVFSGVGKLPWKGEIHSLNGAEGHRFLDIRAWKRLSRYIVDFKPDILQANAGDTLKYAVFSRLVSGWETPIVFRNASEVGRYLNSPLQKTFNKFLYHRLENIISVSEASRKDLIAHFPYLKEHSEVIPVGLEEVDEITPVIFDPPAGKHLIHVGGFSFEKNHHGLLQIFERVLEKEPSAYLHLVGDGPLRSRIEEAVEEQGLQGRVRFYGFVDHPLTYIKGADVLVLPSIIEGLPGVLLEAMYCKVPVVAYNVGGINEIVLTTTGTLIEKDDEVSFSEAILSDLSRPDEERISEAYDMVTRKYMNSEIALKFLKVYSKVTGKKGVK